MLMGVQSQPSQASLPSLEAIDVHLARRSFHRFVKRYWSTIIEEPLVWAKHMDVLCNELQVVAERVFARLPKLYDLVINIPPGTTKSTIATIMFPVWCWVRDPNKETYEQSTASMRFITGSYSADLSLEHADRSRDIIRSDKFKRDFPEIELRKDKDAKSNYANTLKGDRFSTSTGARATGMHGHIILIDDPLNPKQAMAEAKKELKGANNWIDRTLSTRKVDKAVTPIIMIMQRLHEDDCSGHMLAKAKDEGKRVRHICLPDRMNDDVRPLELKKIYIDGLLDPVRLSESILKEAYIDLGSIAYAGQFAQRPAPEGGAIFEVENFKVVEHLPSPIKSQVRYWDKAGTEGAGAYTVGVHMAQLANGQYIVMDVRRKQLSFAKREMMIKQTAEMDTKKVHVWVEQEPGSGGKESMERTIINLAGFVAKGDKVTGEKIVRCQPYASQVAIGNILLKRADWNLSFIDEHETAPLGRYKDQWDSAGGAFMKLSGKKRKAGVW